MHMGTTCGGQSRCHTQITCTDARPTPRPELVNVTIAMLVEFMFMHTAMYVAAHFFLY